MKGGRPRAPGFSLTEVLIVLLLLTLVVLGAWGVLVRHGNAGKAVALRAEALEMVRTLAWLLPRELSSSRAGSDWELRDPAYLQLRAFRGLGLKVDLPSGPGAWMVCYGGTRVPVPEKDSVLLLGSDGRWRAHDLRGRSSTGDPCPGWPGRKVEGWVLFPAPGDAILGRVFETGSYHLADGALRYRRGEGGRQPLTPERLSGGAFHAPVVPGGFLTWDLEVVGGRDALQQEKPTPALRWRGTGR